MRPSRRALPGVPPCRRDYGAPPEALRARLVWVAIAYFVLAILMGSSHAPELSNTKTRLSVITKLEETMSDVTVVPLILNLYAVIMNNPLSLMANFIIVSSVYSQTAAQFWGLF